MSQVQTVMRGGSRFYQDPDDFRVTVPGVTSIISMLPKPFLQYWAAKMAAELAVDSIDYLQSMAERDREGAISFVKGASTRYTKTRAEIGSQAHDLFERMIRGEAIGRVSKDMEPYRFHFADFLAAVNPELISAEDVMWSDKHQYAGSSDAILRVWLDDANRADPTRSGTPCVLITDWKTSKDIHAEVALQLTAYARADRLITPDGCSHDMPAIEGGAVLHVTPEGWTFKPVQITDEVYAIFLALREVFTWDREISKRVLCKAVAQSGASRLVTGTQRRAK
jgi:hypothetical protein